MFTRRIPPKEKFMRHVEVQPNGCWIWTGYRDSKGYGKYTHDKKTRLAHRFSYELFVGYLPSSKGLCHSCDNPPCVNPEHLSPCDQKENMRDAIAHGRIARGERHGSAKLTEEQVIEIKRALATGKSPSQLARELGLPKGTVESIKYGRSWAHITV